MQIRVLAFVLAAIVPLASFAIVTYTRTSSSLTKLESQDMHDQAAGVQAVLRDQAVADLDVLHGSGGQHGGAAAVCG